MTRHYENTETRRRQIAEAALKVIAEQGLGNFTTRTIAKAVGVSDGTLFRHFRHKEDILLAAMDLLEEQMFTSLDPPSDDPLMRLETFFRHRAAFVGSTSSVGRLVFSEQLVLVAGEAGKQKVQSWAQRNLGYVHECLSELKRQGKLTHLIPMEELVRVIQGILLTFAIQSNLGDRPLEDNLEARVSRAWQTIRQLMFP